MLRILAAAAVLAFVGTSSVSLAQQKKKSAPTGKCVITVYGITPTCTSSMTENACNQAAANVRGVASWEEGKSCPRQ